MAVPFFSLLFLATQKSRHLIGFNRIVPYFDISSQITKMEFGIVLWKPA